MNIRKNPISSKGSTWIFHIVSAEKEVLRPPLGVLVYLSFVPHMKKSKILERGNIFLWDQLQRHSEAPAPFLITYTESLAFNFGGELSH